MPHALTVMMAGLRTRGSTSCATFPVAQWLLSAWLAAYRSGGCRGFGLTRTAFPFHPQRGTIDRDDCASSGRESKRFIEQEPVFVAPEERGYEEVNHHGQRDHRMSFAAWRGADRHSENLCLGRSVDDARQQKQRREWLEAT
jgi:hypothetical protein